MIIADLNKIEGRRYPTRWRTSEDVGKVVAALARGDFPCYTGAVLMVDGGLTVQQL